MIKSVEIKNLKSITELDIELGQFNIFIGENGGGKSNILEAIAFGAAASANQLKREFLTSRGIRIPRPELMRAGFSKNNLRKEINIAFIVPQSVDYLINKVLEGENSKDVIEDDVYKKIEFKLQNENQPYSDWYDVEKNEITTELPKILLDFYTGKMDSKFEELEEKDSKTLKKFTTVLRDIPENELHEIYGGRGMKLMIEEQYLKDKYEPHLSGFTIYSPENTFLRRFEDEEKVQPLGIKGEGLFKLLKVFSDEKNKASLKKLKRYLRINDWFEDFELPKQTFEGEKIINIKDRFINNQIFIQQHNSSEGFLFLLFYLSLFISKNTPDFFAIDNIEASFNPKLCSEITEVFNDLSKKHKKQVILTTHNPYILDGLNLNDENQRLFVIRRNGEGKTIAKRVFLPKTSKIKLSEAWMSGFIGGLPKNF